MRTEVEHNENHVILELQDVTYCYDGETLRFYIEGEEMYAVEPAGCILAKPGFMANYVGASFTVK